MSQEYNLSPYHNQESHLETVSVTPLMVEHLRATKPWVRLISVVMFLFSGLMFLGGLAIMLIPSQAGMREGLVFGSLMGFFYFAFGALYLIPAYFLHQYASSINDFLRNGSDSAMETALGSQKSFWRFSGILTLIVIGIYALIFFIAIFGAISAFR